MVAFPYIFGLAGFIVAFMLLAPSYQLVLAALDTSVMDGASKEERGITSGFLNLSRSFGFILGAALSAVSSAFDPHSAWKR